ncbi:Aldolase-type tim barrel family protein, partial [Thalictrum thalictroides]
NSDIPVVAAGSISDARGYAAALALGAKGVCLGTRFIATKEAYANEYYKQQLLSYTEKQTDLTDLYGRKTWRALMKAMLWRTLVMLLEGGGALTKGFFGGAEQSMLAF